MKSKVYSLTFDIDWAPDFVIEDCLDLVDEYGVKATFFATHQSDLNGEIVARGHTLGIHPNFLPHSSHGSKLEEIIEFCLDIVPSAWCMRTHGLVQSSRMLYKIFSTFPQLTLDVSLFMHRALHVQRTLWDHYGVEFERILYNWEDDAEFSKQRFSSKYPIFFGDVTVYCFHPIHVFLNTSNIRDFGFFRQEVGSLPQYKVKREMALKFKNEGLGSRSFLLRILQNEAKSISLVDV